MIHIPSLMPFPCIIKDYCLICESYYEATRSSTLSQIEAIDMGWRAIHNNSPQTLMDRLSGRIKVASIRHAAFSPLSARFIGGITGLEMSDPATAPNEGRAQNLSSLCAA